METTSMLERAPHADVREDLSGICVANLDADLRVLEANDEFIQELGKSATEVYGRHFGGVVHSSVKQVILQHLGRLADGRGRCFNARFVGVRSASKRLSGGMTGLAVRGDDGTVTTIVILVRPDNGVELMRALSHKHKHKPLSELDALVLEGVAAGSSTVQLAAKLYLSRQGVEYHVGAMLRRFKCSNRSALVAKAYAQGILTLGQWPPKVTADFIR
jgi:DNA-binding CsgD family transcriptional regulator